MEEDGRRSRSNRGELIADFCLCTDHFRALHAGVTPSRLRHAQVHQAFSFRTNAASTLAAIQTRRREDAGALMRAVSRAHVDRPSAAGVREEQETIARQRQTARYLHPSDGLAREI